MMTSSNQYYVVLYFYEEPSILVLMNNLELSSVLVLDPHTKIENLVLGLVLPKKKAQILH
jgi:hypothetical protein